MIKLVKIGTTDTEIVTGDLDTKYIFVSHSWINLSNPDDWLDNCNFPELFNATFAGQLRNYLKSYGRLSGYFWIDVVCNANVSNMRDIITRADNVLLLNPHNLSLDEIATEYWMNRIWMFTELLLGKDMEIYQGNVKRYNKTEILDAITRQQSDISQAAADLYMNFKKMGGYAIDIPNCVLVVCTKMSATVENDKYLLMLCILGISSIKNRDPYSEAIFHLINNGCVQVALSHDNLVGLKDFVPQMNTLPKCSIQYTNGKKFHTTMAIHMTNGYIEFVDERYNRQSPVKVWNLVYVIAWSFPFIVAGIVVTIDENYEAEGFIGFVIAFFMFIFPIIICGLSCSKRKLAIDTNTKSALLLNTMERQKRNIVEKSSRVWEKIYNIPPAGDRLGFLMSHELYDVDDNIVLLPVVELNHTMIGIGVVKENKYVKKGIWVTTTNNYNRYKRHDFAAVM